MTPFAISFTLSPVFLWWEQVVVFTRLVDYSGPSFSQFKMPDERSPLLKDSESQRPQPLGITQLLAGLVGTYPFMLFCAFLRSTDVSSSTRCFSRECRQIYSPHNSEPDCVRSPLAVQCISIAGIVQSWFLCRTASGRHHPRHRALPQSEPD